MGVNHLGVQMPLAELLRQVRQVAVASIQNSGIGRAGLRVYNAGRILFQGGGGVVIEDDGFIDIDGDLTGRGALDWTGPWTLNSTEGGEIGGDVDLTGILNILGGGKIKLGNITIDGATGKIHVDQMVIDPANGGSIGFPGGAIVKAGSGGGVAVQQGSYAAVITSSGASLGRSGYSFSVTDAGGFRADGIPLGNPGTAYPKGVIYKNTAGQLREASGS